MKVVKITANFPPRRCGIGNYTRLLCENLVNLKKDIYFYIITSADPKIKECNYSYERIEVLPAISDWSFTALRRIRKIIKEISPDIVHMEFNRMLYGRAIAINFLPYLLKKKNSIPKIIVTFHDLPGPLKNRDPFFWLTTFVILIYCDSIIVTNEIDFNSFTCKLPFVKRKCRLVPVGSNIFKAESKRALVREELNISEDTLILSFFGFIREDKCLSELLYAFSKLLRARDNLKLIIVGGTHNQKIFLSLKKLVNKLNMNNAVIWMGYLPDKRVSELLSVSDAAVLPYKNGIGTNSGVFAACALHDLPIVTTNAKFMPDVIKNNYNLILVKPGSIEELTKALFKITEDSDLRKKLSENLKELNEYLSWQRISEEIFKLYV